MDSGQAEPGGDGKSYCRGVSAALVDAGAPEAGSQSEGGGSGFYRDSKTAGYGLSHGISETFYSTNGIANESGGREIQNDALYCLGGGGVTAADRLRKCGELAAGTGNDTGEGVCHPLGAGSKPKEIGAATSSREPDTGHRWSSSGNAAGVGRTQVSGSADAARDYPSRVRDPAKHSSSGVHAGCGSADRAGIRAGAGAESGAEGHQRSAAGQWERD